MFAKSNKVQFQDNQLDDYVLENSVLKSKLQSKVDALSIMSKELDKCSMERDRYRLLVEQMKTKNLVVQDNSNNFHRFTPMSTISGSEILAKTKENNDALKLEVELLRSKLDEAEGDILALRKHLRNNNMYDENSVGSVFNMESPTNNNHFENLVQDLEKIQKKYQQIQLDYRATLDEKEELISDRDYYKNKVQRLNHQISYILANRMKKHADMTENNTEQNVDLPNPLVDIDALTTENKYLHERITQLQVEKEIIKRTLTKYKTLLDNRAKSNNLKKGLADVMTQKQVREYLDMNSKTGLKRTSAAEMKSLCLGLIEALNDKSIALQHQRKTNQILANRITELEKTLESWCNGQKCIPIFPSQMLIEEVLNDNNSVKSDEKDEHDTPEDNTDIQDNTDSENDVKDKKYIDFENDYCSRKSVLSSKTVLPQELEELVKEALAELKSEH